MSIDKTIAPTRPKQTIPAELITGLLAIVRSQFCGDMTGQEWGQNSHFIRKNVILWPAHFILNKKGFTITAKRYDQIMRSIFDDIKRHGTSGVIKYWPGYLMKCVQDHWKHNWEDYYNESKSIRNLEESTLLALGTLPVRSDQTVQALATAHSVLAARSKKQRKPAVKEQALPGF